MLNLKKKLNLDAAAIASPNLCDRFSTEDLQAIGNLVHEGYTRDRQSRSKWEKRTAAAMDLAMQVVKTKTFPWAGASNVAFPLVTIATLQFHSRAYPALVNGAEVVKCRVLGDDPDGQRHARAERISAHMSYQVIEEDQPWEEQHDKLLINLPIVGCAFKKSYPSSSLGHNVSELVLAQDLVLDYYAKSVESCARKTHVIPLHRNELRERMSRGTYRDVKEAEWFQADATTPLETDPANARQGTEAPQPDSTTPFRMLEQHCLMDLDGDGYLEPYIVTIEEVSRETLRIVTRFEERDVERDRKNQIIAIRPVEYFTKYAFIPAPDGGIYDVGFGMLLGPLNESVNTALNQIFDAGTMATTGGGFLGRGVKIRGGSYAFQPNEWKRVDSTGDDLSKNVVPLPKNEPSSVLFQVLSLLIEYTRQVAGANEMMSGQNPGQNTPAETSRTMVEQGHKIYSAIFKRVWRSMKEEFKKLYLLNAVYLDPGKKGLATREDYLGDPNEVIPAADPNITSDEQRVQQAHLVKQAAMTTPGYDKDQVEIYWLKANRVEGWQTLFKGAKQIPPPPNPKMLLEQIKAQTKTQELKQKMAQFMMQMQSEQDLNHAKIVNLEALAAKAIAEAGGIKEGHEIALFEAQIGAARAHDESLRSYIGMMMEQLTHDEGTGLSGMAGGPAHPSVQALGGNSHSPGPGRMV